MKDQDKTKTQLIDELAQLRQRLAECESSEAKRRGTGEEQRRSEEQLRLVIDAMPALISYVDSEQCYRLSNKAHEQWFGYGPGEAKGCHIKEVLGEDVYKEIKQHVEMALSGKQATYETKVSHRDGGTRHVVVTYVPDFTAQGEVRGFFGLATDITERKQAEERLREAHNELERRVEERTAELAKANEQLRREIAERKQAEQALQESKERLQVIFDSMQTAVVIIDAESHMIVDANPVAVEIIGVHREEIIGRVCHEFICPAEKGKCPITDLGQSIDKSERVLINARGEAITILKTVIPIVLDGSTHLIDSFIDITERKRAEDALASSEEFLNSVIEQSPVSLWIADSEGTLKKLNQSCRELFGVTDEEVVGKYNLFKDNLIKEQGFMPLVENVFEKGEVARFTIDYDLPRVEHVEVNGATHRILDVIVSPIKDMHCKVTNAIVQHNDITKRKRAEEALRKSEERFRDIAESTLEWIWEVDADGKYIYTNSVVEAILGYESEEILGKHFYDLFYPEEREELKKAAFEMFALKQPFREYTNRNAHKSGRIVWLSTSGVPILDVQGKLLGYRGADTDITERKQAEEELRASEEKWRATVENAPVGVGTTDMDGRFLSMNSAYCDMLGYSFDELRNLTFDEITHPDDRERSREAFSTLLKGDSGSVEFEKRYIRKDGSAVNVIQGGGIVRDTAGNPVLIIGISQDITERKRAEEKIRAFQSRLRSLASRLSLAEERERKRLAAGVHDQIGQPLAVLQMKLGILREPLSSTGLEKQLDEIRELVGHMIQNTRSLTFELSPPILYELGLEPALEWLVEQVQEEHSIVGRFEDDGQTKPLGDDARGFVFWVVRELLMNVIKHARAQAVTVSVCRDDGELRMVVEDDGVGFDTMEMEKRARGFGLFSIRERLTEFGGQFEVKSELGRGTRVILVVPLESGGESAGGN